MELPSDATISPELRAQLHYWRGEALARRGDATGAAAEADHMREALNELRALVPEPARPALMARPDIRAIGGA